MSQIVSESGIHMNQLHKWKTQFLQEMSQVFKKQNQDMEKMKADYEKQLDSLYSEVGKLTTQLSWLKKNLAFTTTRQERMEMVDWTASELPISHQADLLGINRTSLYYKPVQPSQEEMDIKNRYPSRLSGTQFE